MTKRVLRILLSVILAGATLLALFGCGYVPENTADENTVGIADIAEDLQKAFTHEYDLYLEVVSEGSFTGTFVEFLRAINITVSDDTAAVNYAMTSVVAIETTTSAGSGIVWSIDKTKGNAVIVTNYHVVYNAMSRKIDSSIKLYFYGSYSSASAIRATYVGGEMDNDVAVLRVDNSSFLRETQTNKVYVNAITLGNSQTVTAGERVYALGNPNGEGLSVIAGVVSNPFEYIVIESADGTKALTIAEIRTDATVNHGNSGGALVNAKGELIGIVNAREEGGLYSGFALPIHIAGPVAQQLISAYYR